LKIVAEVGSNFHSFDDCKTAVSLAKSCGADAVKFQLYTYKELFGLTGKLSSELPREWLPKLKEKADAVGIELMCTAFSPEGLRYVDQFVSTHKIASSEMCHLELIDAALETRKPIYISTGAQTETDIIALSNYIGKCSATFLYCEAAYPSTRSDLRRILRLEEITKRPAGFSDHSVDVLNIPRIAFEYGAMVLEKHFNPFEYKDTPDAPHSLNIDDFQAMVYSIREPALPVLYPTRDEIDMVLRHKRRLIATELIKPGDTLRLNENYGVYRSLKSETKGAHPGAHRNNSVAFKHYSPGDAIE
jgi:sialic acid synthase SpsE